MPETSFTNAVSNCDCEFAATSASFAAQKTDMFAHESSTRHGSFSVISTVVPVIVDGLLPLVEPARGACRSETQLKLRIRDLTRNSDHHSRLRDNAREHRIGRDCRPEADRMCLRRAVADDGDDELRLPARDLQIVAALDAHTRRNCLCQK